VEWNALFSQLLIGLINGSFYALLSLGLAVIFGMLNIINFAHGAFYMIGAFAAYFLMALAGIGYWGALIIAPVLVGIVGMVTERLLLRRLASMDHLYGLLMTFGLALVLQGVFQVFFGSSGLPYPIPKELSGGVNLGFMFLPTYRGWVVGFSLIACIATWYLIERTRLGAYLRAATENPDLVRAFGINVPLMITLTYGLGVALAALAGVLSAPINSVRPLMGADLIIIVFAVVVIGGMGSILGAIVTGFGVGVVEGLTKYLYPEASNTVIFVLMILVLLIKPTGLTGRGGETAHDAAAPETASASARGHVAMIVFGLVSLGLALLPLTSVYLYFVMQVLCFALVAGAFNLLIGHGGLLSFGHAMFFGTAGYVTAHGVKVLELSPELGILVGVCASGALAALAGAISIRRQGIYFAMITLAISQMLYFVYLRVPFTHGEDGIQGVPQGNLFGLFDLGDMTTLYYVILGGFLLGTLLIYRTISSPFGQVLKSVRENEPRAISLGYRTTMYKYVAFIISGTLAGFAGSLKVFVVQSASLTDVHWSMSGEIVLITLVGGLGTLLGPLAGAFVIIASQHYLAESGQWVTVLQGAIFIACVLAFRRGIVGELARHLKISL
tara:strand:- start:57429 stop:59270 length:1842 start_codon:yes stop_codon:yes gene_type:complete